MSSGVVLPRRILLNELNCSKTDHTFVLFLRYFRLYFRYEWPLSIIFPCFMFFRKYFKYYTAFFKNNTEFSGFCFCFLVGPYRVQHWLSELLARSPHLFDGSVGDWNNSFQLFYCNFQSHVLVCVCLRACVFVRVMDWLLLFTAIIALKSIILHS